MNSDFRELLQCFTKHKVRYLVVGGYAVIHSSSGNSNQPCFLSFLQRSDRANQK